MSNYGPKSINAYNAADNARRKSNNTGDTSDSLGPNQNSKSYSTKPGQLSAKTQADVENRRYKSLNRKQPVKTLADMSQDEINRLQLTYCSKVS